mgnify:CR=1 FL=1
MNSERGGYSETKSDAYLRQDPKLHIYGICEKLSRATTPSTSSFHPLAKRRVHFIFQPVEVSLLATLRNFVSARARASVRRNYEGMHVLEFSPELYRIERFSRRFSAIFTITLATTGPCIFVHSSENFQSEKFNRTRVM